MSDHTHGEYEISENQKRYYTPTTGEVLYCAQCGADLELYPPITEPVIFERDFTVNTETVRKVYRYVRTDATEFDSWLAEVIREAKNDAWHEGFSAGWDECDDPSGFVNDKWDAKTPSPYRKGESND